ncbi:MAG: hypothetical protein O7H39_00815 [Gammaproteobacteria bacterium]|nr:hypothetical protein [Gammaproteobacteria bacterium]
MHEIALDLLIRLAGIWLIAVTLRPLGLPTVMGELIVGVLLGLRDRTGCTVVAVERDGELIMDFPPSFVLAAMDTLYVCGTAGAFARYDEAFAEASA